jgi:hypothetical protein
MVGFIPHGDEQQLSCRRIPGAVMNDWFEAWWEINQNLKDDDIYLFYEQNCLFCRNLNASSPEWNKLLSEYDLFVFHDLPSCLNPLCIEKLGHKSLAIIAEPPTVIPSQYDSRLLNKFASVFSWNDDIVNGKKIKKFFYPVLTRYQGGLPFSYRKISCMMCGNKSSTFRGELYSERKRIINYFKKDVDVFSLYGPGWEKLGIKTYKGNIPFKYPALRETIFNFCLENTTGVKGYVTEKIFDAFEAGCVPIYSGPSNIDEYIPRDCYIDYKRFKSLKDLREFMLDFTEAEYREYQKNIVKFLLSDQAKNFSAHRYANLMTHEIKTLLLQSNERK